MSSLDTAGELADEAVPVNGTVKLFGPVKGYGFVVPKEGGVDILVDDSTLRRGGHNILYPIARIKCTIVERAKGLQADRIIVVDNSKGHLAHNIPRPTSLLAEIVDVSNFECAVFRGLTEFAGSVSSILKKTGWIYSCIWKFCEMWALKCWCLASSLWCAMKVGLRD